MPVSNELLRGLGQFLGLVAAAAAGLGVGAAIAARTGDMKKLVFHTAPKSTTSAAFDLADDAGKATLADYKGRVVLVNFWATWCGPCEREMPSLAALETARGGEDFKVIAISVDDPADKDYAVRRLRELSGNVLTFYTLSEGPEGWNAVYDMGAGGGFPTTILYDKQGLKVAKLEGEADWANYQAVALIDAIRED